jgi:hypothetical protein
MRDNTRSAPAKGGNAFDSLENETTQAIRVSPELLGLAREEDASGATKAYEVPPELLELARSNKQKRLAARQAASVESTPAEAAPASTVCVDSGASQHSAPPPLPSAALPLPSAALPVRSGPPPLPNAAPRVQRVIVQDDTLPAVASKRVAEAVALPDVRNSVAQKRAKRWLLTGVCLLVISVASVLCGRLVRDGHTGLSAVGISQLF